METPKPAVLSESLPEQLAEVFRALRLGKHLCRDDGVLFRDVEQNQETYRLLLERLGYTLVRHGQGFFYLQGSSTLSSSRLESLTLFVLLLFQDLEDRKFETRERMWEKTLIVRTFSINELPHFATAEKRKMMNAVGVTSDTLQKKVLKVLATQGMLELLPQEKFRFRAPIFRYIDLCVQYASDQWNKSEPDAAATSLPQPPDTTIESKEEGE